MAKLAEVKVQAPDLPVIEGEDYDDEVYLEAEQRAQDAIAEFVNAGARAENIATVVEIGIEQAVE